MKIFKCIVILAVTFLLVNCKDAPKTIAISEMAWLQGSWMSEDKSSVETWAIQGDSLSGNVYSAGAKKITEVLSIKEVGNSWVYSARVLDQNEGNTIYFHLEDYSEGNLLFTNPDHDFPNSLSYSKLNDKTINIIIAGKDGQSSTFRIFKLD